MDGAKEGKVCKARSAGAAEGSEGGEERQSRGQRLVAEGGLVEGANPGDGRPACHWKYITPVISRSSVLARKVRDHL